MRSTCATGRPLPDETRLYIPMLAPTIAGGQFEDAPIDRPELGAWLRGLLFPAQAQSKPADNRLSFSMRLQLRSTDRAIVDLSGLAPQPGDLFARRIAALQPK